MTKYKRGSIKYSTTMMKELIEELGLGNKLIIDREISKTEDINKLKLEDIELETKGGEIVRFNKISNYNIEDKEILLYLVSICKEGKCNNEYNFTVKEIRTKDKPLEYELESIVSFEDMKSILAI